MPRPRRTSAVAALLACLTVVAVAASPAGAARNATKKEAAAIATAVFSSPMGKGDPQFRRQYRAVRPRVSTLSRHWAKVDVVARPRYAGRLQGGYAIAVHPAGESAWVVVDFGTADVGCGIAPDAVIADLLGVKTVAAVCPPGQGIG